MATDHKRLAQGKARMRCSGFLCVFVSSFAVAACGDVWGTSSTVSPTPIPYPYPYPPPSDGVGLLIGKGDSVTWTPALGPPSYFDIAAKQLAVPMNWMNRAVPGTRVGLAGDVGTNSWLWQVDSDIIAQFDGVPDDEPKIVTVAMGNTLHDHDPSPADNGNAVEYFEAIRRSSNNIKVILVDSNPRNDSKYTKRRSAVEAWGASHSGIHFDGYVSLRGLTDDAGEESATGDAILFPEDDHIHPLAAWHQIIASEALAPALNKMIAEFYADSTGPVAVRMTRALGFSEDLTNIDLLTVRFDEHVKFGSSVSVYIHDRSGTIIESLNPGPSLSVHGVDLEIRPAQALAASETYFVTMSAGSLTDVHGNAFDGMTDPINHFLVFWSETVSLLWTGDG